MEPQSPTLTGAAQLVAADPVAVSEGAIFAQHNNGAAHGATAPSFRR